jgi:hypothetical protein
MMMLAVLLAIPGLAHAKAGVQMCPGGQQTLVSKDVGDERWAIMYDIESHVAMGNVFFTSGGPPAFVWCQRTGTDDTGSIPADAGGYKCSVGLAKAYSKLRVSVYKCHVKAASSGLASKPFDQDGCEDGAPPLKSARAKDDAYVAKLAATGVCPACVLANAPTLADDLTTNLDAQNAEIFPCA